MNVCYPIVEIIYSSEYSCNHQWTNENLIGTDGTYGEIWSVCCAHDCNHVLKYMPYNDGNRFNAKEDIINEINTQNKCAAIGLCPVVQDAWLCETGGVFVMELYKMTAKQLLLLYKDITDKQKILANIITLLDKLHRHGIYHGDLHLDNIMIKSLLANEDRYNDSNYEYYFIDFGKGGTFTTMSDMNIKNDYIEIAAHIQDMINEYPNNNFDQLYDTMKIYMKKFD